MTTVKFSVWDGKTMLYPDDIGDFAIDDLRNGMWQIVRPFVININGFDIYQHDVVEFEAIDAMRWNEESKSVGGKYVERSEVKWDEKSCSFNLPWLRYGTLFFPDIKSVKVIGDTCQNPELSKSIL